MPKLTAVILHALLLPAAAFLLPPIAGSVARHAPASTPISFRKGGIRMDMPNIDGTGFFRDKQEYPLSMDIKIIGLNEGPFASDMRTLCAEITGQAEEDVPIRWRDNGKYRAITLTLHFGDADKV